mmetsp:Transcript_13998/g.13603  ORF Transcript_13998/g.13603 Transcript_13998/m.13603 type:complete len:165 (+) Transcript_13998:377-871(+)
MQQFQEGSGKSSSFFFFTSNSQFAIKTLKPSELKLLTTSGFLSKYYHYLAENPYSMLTRYYGVYKIKIKYMQPVSVVVMDNLMGANANLLTSIYDLKGSTFKRLSKNPFKGTVLKDLNFLQNSRDRVKVNPALQNEIIRRIENDKNFLNSQYLMDYSLLIMFFR